MKAFINIENDQELRNHCKNLMIGQIKSITREETTEVIKEVIKEKILNNGDNYAFRNLMKECMTKAIKDILRNEFGITEWENQYITPIVTNQVELSLQGKNWSSIIDTIATNKIKSMLK